ncbi:D-alanyl-D-alanine carboxypeptidase family protein [Endozoicomonas arenosclerae]|uniref:D-alanyl-D-alanine carboxypeptidase family protein n=1 Tax=Endozoicomonas arenosclerae TaxID=1633495 RepID=UPI001C12A19D|nr:D-alanyl-D-alanine carboxypeptidase family protein [Endozoicomonas arenosclerae]
MTSIIPNAPAINAKGFVLMDYDSGQIIASENAETALAPASLTKMMTAYVIGREINSGRLSFDDKVTISRNAWSRNFPDSSKMFIEPGDKISVGDLSRGIMVQSGNDASVAMAEHIAGSEGAFVDLMNSWATRLGMTNTQFINAHGLDGDSIATTPRDMAILTQRLIQDAPEVYQIYQERSFKWNGITQYNRNQLLWDRSLNVDGGKTGYTSNAGYSLVTSATQEGMRLITVVMGTPSKTARLEESRKLLTYGFRFFETSTLLDQDSAVQTEKVWMGTQDQINLGVNDDISVTLPKGQARRLKVEYEINTPLKAPLEEGSVLGQVRWVLGDETIKEANLMAIEAVEQGSLIKRLVDSVLLFINNLKQNLLS